MKRFHTPQAKSTASLAFLVLFSIPAYCQQSKVTDQDLLLARNPVIIKDRVRFSDEFSDPEAGGHSHKMVLAGVYGFGFNGIDKNFALAFEAPVLLNNPKAASSAEGIGDFKLTFGHLVMDDPDSWRAGWFFNTEFDTAADRVQAIANQRTQMALGIGASHPLCKMFTLSSSLQYGWSLDEGTTTGRKDEWEAHLTGSTKLTDNLSLNLDYKFVVNAVGGTEFFHTLEPSLGYTFGADRQFGLFSSCEVPLFNGGVNWIAKSGVVWFF